MVSIFFSKCRGAKSPIDTTAEILISTDFRGQSSWGSIFNVKIASLNKWRHICVGKCLNFRFMFFLYVFRRKFAVKRNNFHRCDFLTIRGENLVSYIKNRFHFWIFMGSIYVVDRILMAYMKKNCLQNTYTSHLIDFARYLLRNHPCR